MAPKKKENPEGGQKKEPKLELRDLKAKKELRGGAGQRESTGKPRPGTTGEIDFMSWE
jgi:hypothetical protein